MRSPLELMLPLIAHPGRVHAEAQHATASATMLVRTIVRIPGFSRGFAPPKDDERPGSVGTRADLVASRQTFVRYSMVAGCAQPQLPRWCVISGGMSETPERITVAPRARERTIIRIRADREGYGNRFRLAARAATRFASCCARKRAIRIRTRHAAPNAADIHRGSKATSPPGGG